MSDETCDLPFEEPLRDQLAARNAEHKSEFYILVNEEVAEEIASGYVRSSIKAQVRTMLDWLEEDQRRANRP